MLKDEEKPELMIPRIEGKSRVWKYDSILQFDQFTQAVSAFYRSEIVGNSVSTEFAFLNGFFSQGFLEDLIGFNKYRILSWHLSLEFTMYNMQKAIRNISFH